MMNNESTVDRVVRVGAGGVLLGTGLTGVIPGGWGIAAGVVGAVVVITGALGFCPLYAAFGISTRRRD